MDEILIPCHLCGVHWPESHILRWTDRSGDRYDAGKPLTRVTTALSGSSPLDAFRVLPRHDICCVCADEFGIADEYTTLKDKRRILKIRDQVLEKLRQRRDGPDAVAEWTPDLDPPRG